MTDCSERRKLLAEYRHAIDKFIENSEKLRDAKTPHEIDAVLTATETAQLACDEAKAAFQTHLHYHGCARDLERPVDEPVFPDLL